MTDYHRKYSRQEVTDVTQTAVTSTLEENPMQLIAMKLTAESVQRALAQIDPAMQVPFMTDPAQVGLINPTGLVEVEQANGTQTAVLRQSVIQSGQVVHTGPLSSVSLLFFDGSRADLGPQSEILLETVDALLPGEGFRTVILTQLTGESVHTVQFRNDSGSRYEVRTLTASGIARGTQYGRNSRRRHLAHSRATVAGRKHRAGLRSDYGRAHHSRNRPGRTPGSRRHAWAMPITGSSQVGLQRERDATRSSPSISLP